MNRNILKQLSKDLSVAVSAFERMALLEKLLNNNDIDDWHPVEDILVKILRVDENPIVRHEAAFVLGRLYSSGRIMGIDALNALSKSAYNDPSIVVRHEAAESLGFFRSPQAKRVLNHLLNDGCPDVVATAQIALEHLSNNYSAGNTKDEVISNHPTKIKK